MKRKTTYTIPFKGLKDGIHTFEFKMGESFFQEFESTEINRGDLTAEIELNRHTTFLELSIDITGKAEVICDRCLEPFMEDVSFHGNVYVKFGSESIMDDEIWVIPEEEHELDLAHYLYESINLSLPMKRVHPDDENGDMGCSPEMIAKLNEFQGAMEQEESTDPRWDALKDLLSNKN